MDVVGVIFRMKKCLLSVWEAMKGDVYMHFAVTQVDSLWFEAGNFVSNFNFK